MKNVAILVLIAVCASVLLAGCGTVDSQEDRALRDKMNRDIALRQFVDDWDYFWLADRNIRMTQWHPRTGH